MKKVIRHFQLILVFGFLILSFQNCQQTLPGFESIQSSSSGPTLFSSSNNGGNGGTYDGKIWGRLVPGFECNGQAMAYGQLNMGSDIATLISGCAQDKIKQIPIADLEISKLSSDYIGYEDGLYSVTHNLADDLSLGNFTEAFCQESAGKIRGGNLPEFEVGIHWQQAGNHALSKFFKSMGELPVESTIERSIEIDRVRYFTSSYSLEIQTSSRLPGTHKFAGVYQSYQNGILNRKFIECRLGGQFDIVAPSFSYSENFLTVSIDDAPIQLSPQINKNTVSFKVHPALPNGLSLNRQSGVISGKALNVTPRNTYTVTAVFEFGEVARALSIGIGHAMSVTSDCADEACSWVNVIEKANSKYPEPVIIGLKDGTYISDALNLSIKGDIEIRGQSSSENLVLDAQGLSRHFIVESNAHLSLAKLTLKNGTADSGGAILVNQDGYLHASHVIFENNNATSTNRGQGGAIFNDGGKLSIRHSVFQNNTAPRGGTSVQGGAISSQYATVFHISDSRFVKNSAANGGAIELVNPPNLVFEILNTEFTENNAAIGGAIDIRSGKVVIQGSTFSKNAAVFHGGALNTLWTDGLWISGSRFVENMAAYGFAIKYQESGLFSKFYLLDSVIKDNVIQPIMYNFGSPQGSALLYKGEVRMGNTVLENAHENLKNCSKIFEGDSSIVVSLGRNIINDDSCKTSP